MKSARSLWMRWLEHLLVIGLSIMGLMVFANVVLRYVFDDGIAVTEEVARFIFVWITFIGSIVAMKEGLHLGMQSLTRNLPKPIRVGAQILSHALMLLCCAVLLKGSLDRDGAEHKQRVGVIRHSRRLHVRRRHCRVDSHRLDPHPGTAARLQRHRASRQVAAERPIAET